MIKFEEAVKGLKSQFVPFKTIHVVHGCSQTDPISHLDAALLMRSLKEEQLVRITC